MPKLQVTTQDLDAASSALSGNVGGTVNQMASSAGGVHASAPGFATADAINRFSAAWSTGLTALAHVCGQTAAALSSASGTYQQAEGSIASGNQAAACKLSSFGGK